MKWWTIKGRSNWCCSFLARRDIWSQSYQIFESVKTHQFIHLLIDKPSIKSIETCIVRTQTVTVITVAVRASYIWPILRPFFSENLKNPEGGLSPPGNNQSRNQLVILSFGVDPLNWQSFIEIDEMACFTTVWCSRGHILNGSLKLV